MGVHSVEYGHIFVYKNGLRIYPYGDRNEDPLRMDNRKSQGHSRYIGTRESMGYIFINEPNDELRETSSRGDGLIKSKSYFELVEWFYDNLKRLEKYIIDITDWGNELSNDDYIKLDNQSQKKAIEDLIVNLTKSKGIISFEVAPEIFEILDKKQEKSTKNTLTKIKRQLESNDYDKDAIVESISKIEKSLDDLKKNSEEATEEALEKGIKNEELETNLEVEIKKGAFKGALIGTDKERIVSLQHQVFHSSGRIHRNIKLLIRQIGLENLDDKSQKHIAVISREITKINSIAKFITKANFNLTASEIQEDIVDFMEDYIKEVYLFEDKIIDTKMDISINTNDLNLEKIFRPLEVTTLIDILISNSEKAKASEIHFTFKLLQNKTYLFVSDNGNGIHENYLNSIFDLGFTTTNGSGIGLFQAKEIVKNDLGGDITVEKTSKEGTTFKIELD
jgi:hypothetical protein